MQVYRKRCKHCGADYWYNTYDNFDGCTDEFCSNCSKIINEIPVRFEPRWKKIDNPYLLELFQRVEKSESEKKVTDGLEFVPVSILWITSFDNYVEMHHNGIYYRMFWNDDTPDEKKFYIEMTYDISKEAFSDEPWIHYDIKDGLNDFYYYHHTEKSVPVDMDISVNPLDLPSALLSYLDPVMPKKTKMKKEPKPKHEIKTFTYVSDGQTIKGYISDGRWIYDGKAKVTVKDCFDADALMDRMEYEYVIEYYDDDRLNETITNIRIK